MQIYFMLPGFVETLSRFAPDKFSLANLEKTIKKTKFNRIASSIDLISELQLLFGYLWNSNRSYVEVKGIAEKLVDDLGSPIRTADVNEFSRSLLLRLNEVLELERSAPLSKELPDISDSQVLGMSVLLPVIPEQLAKTFIYNTFFGTFQVTTKAIDKNGNEVELNTSKAFGHIEVKPIEETLYKCWEASYYHDIQNFHTPSVLSLNEA
eukprot:TRINITY_DN7930_c0_g1_i1.p1 TRINITY_DN7930_c0_g1~~TRINITY_DN7930_c0_g1_i1.p1  ORF type:complete len:209 (-),score=59.84 TRINITY_DN7930_c0_g1_i1:405-1031(-)